MGHVLDLTGAPGCACGSLVDRTTGYQNEVPDVWLTDGNPWEVKRNDVRFKVSFGGKVDKKDGKSVWTPAEEVWAVAYDNPVPGFRTPTCANLRLWDAQPLEEFDLGAFNAGEYDKVGICISKQLQRPDYGMNWTVVHGSCSGRGQDEPWGLRHVPRGRWSRETCNVRMLSQRQCVNKLHT
eukprot:scaffold14479_cov23-Tisochrysis_lutea.AAC.6